MIKFIIKPFDILFFGTGRPFNFNVQEATSRLLPFPHTLAGAISNKISAEKGIDTSKIIKHFYGPFLEKENEILFPRPLDILSEKKQLEGEISGIRLVKNSKLIKPSFSDCGSLEGLLWQEEKNKEFEVADGFITHTGLKKWFNNQRVEKKDLISPTSLLNFESRVGISMDYSKNVTKEEDALYRIDFVRFQSDTKIIFFVEFDYNTNELQTSNLNNENALFQFFKDNQTKVLKLGGEMRAVSYDCERVTTDLATLFAFRKPAINESDTIKILYLTSGFLADDENAYRIICGSVKIINLGLRTKDYGTKIKKAIKEGSVIYVKVNNVNNLESIWLNPINGEFIGSNLRIYTKLINH